jgi:hypothetical protein
MQPVVLNGAIEDGLLNSNPAFKLIRLVKSEKPVCECFIPNTDIRFMDAVGTDKSRLRWEQVWSKAQPPRNPKTNPPMAV